MDCEVSGKRCQKTAQVISVRRKHIGKGAGNGRKGDQKSADKDDTAFILQMEHTDDYHAGKREKEQGKQAVDNRQAEKRRNACGIGQQPPAEIGSVLADIQVTDIVIVIHRIGKYK